MTYEEFKNAVVNELQNRIPQIESIELRVITKNNDVKREGMLIREKGVNISQTFYLDELFKQYERGCSLDAILEGVQGVYAENRKDADFNVSFLDDFQEAKEHIIFKLVNKEKNEKLLETVPYIDFLDLAIVFYYYTTLLGEDKQNGTILITNKILENWQVTKDEIYEAAKRNTPIICAGETSSMDDFIRELTGMEFEDANRFFIVSNKQKVYGAGTILYDGIIQKLSEETGEDLFIIPSSIHEVIVIPAVSGSMMNAKDIKEIIKYVNTNELNASDFLSDSLYYYSKEMDNICIA